MKPIILCLFLEVLFRTLAVAQCPPGSVTLQSQAEVDAYVAAYPNCTTINGDLWIGKSGNSNSDISDISGLSSLINLDGVLSISLCPNLNNINGLANLLAIGGLVLMGNNSLTSIAPLDNVESSFIIIAWNSSLTSLTGLESSSELEYLSIYANSSLTSLSGLEGLIMISGNCSIEENPALLSLSALSNLTYIGGGLSIEDNANLTSLLGLDNVSSVGLELWILSNPTLTSLSGLGSLTSVGDLVLIGGNPLISNINSLSNLTSIGGYLYIEGNTSLNSLFGLDNIDPTSINYLSLFDNGSALTICSVQSICEYLENGGIADIGLNGPGCNSVPEVQAACLLLPVELTTFTAQKRNAHAHLAWRTAAEQNAAYFHVERSPDARQWQAIGSASAHGTTNEQHEYAFTDEQPLPGPNYYRLRQEDHDGSLAYSHIVSVAFQPQKTELFDLYPNPVGEELTLTSHHEAPLLLRVCDQFGRQVAEQTLGTRNQMKINTAAWMPGIYLIEGVADGRAFRQRIVKQ
jgi:hypothetical protein